MCILWLLIQQKGQTLIFQLQLVCAGQHVMGHQHERVQTSQQQQQSKQGDCSSAAAVLASGGANQPDRATHACNLGNSCCCCSSWCDSPTPGGCRTTVWEGRTHACWHSSQNTGCQHATHVQGDVWGLQSESVWGQSSAAAGRAAHSDTGHWRPTRLLLLRAHAHKPPLRASSLRLPPAATSPRCTANWRCCTAA